MLPFRDQLYQLFDDICPLFRWSPCPLPRSTPVLAWVNSNGGGGHAHRFVVRAFLFVWRFYLHRAAAANMRGKDTHGLGGARALAKLRGVLSCCHVSPPVQHPTWYVYKFCPRGRAWMNNVSWSKASKQLPDLCPPPLKSNTGCGYSSIFRPWSTLCPASVLLVSNPCRNSAYSFLFFYLFPQFVSRYHACYPGRAWVGRKLPAPHLSYSERTNDSFFDRHLALPMPNFRRFLKSRPLSVSACCRPRASKEQ